MQAKQTISFELGDKVDRTYDKNHTSFENIASSNAELEGATIKSCTISDDIQGYDIFEDFAEGSFTITGAGTITVEVTFSETEHYAETKRKYVLNVERSEQKISFSETDQDVEDTFYLGMINSYVILPLLIPGDGVGDVTYSILDGTDQRNVVGSIKDGKIQLNFVPPVEGAADKEFVETVTIVANKAQDRCYKDASAQYDLTIRVHVGEKGSHYSFSSSPKSTGWYTDSDLFIYPQAGYDMYDVAFIDTMEYIVLTQANDKQNLERDFWVEKDGIDYYCHIKIDKDSKIPTISSIQVNSKTYNWFQTMFFGKPKEKTTFTIIASDDVSQIAKYQYYIDKNNGVKTPEDILAIPESEWTEGSEAVVRRWDDNPNPVVFYAKVTDNAGNVAYKSTNEMIFSVNETKVTFTPSNESYYNKNFTVNFKVEDVDAGIKNIYLLGIG